jgi:hypothetical protein
MNKLDVFATCIHNVEILLSVETLLILRPDLLKNHDGLALERVKILKSLYRDVVALRDKQILWPDDLFDGTKKEGH